MASYLKNNAGFFQVIYVGMLAGSVVGTWVLALILFIVSQCWGETFKNVEVVKVYDGDTITVNLSKQYPDLFAKKLGVRINGIDTPEIRGKCPKEKALAIEARDLVQMMIDHSSKVDLLNAKRGKYFRIVADVEIDGRSVSEFLLEKGLAVRYDGGTKVKDWCE